MKYFRISSIQERHVVPLHQLITVYLPMSYLYLYSFDSYTHETPLATTELFTMALAPPQSTYPPSSPSPSASSSQNQNQNQNETPPPSRPSLHLQLNTTFPPIPAFLQSILSAHPSIPTPLPATPNVHASSALYTLPQAPPPPEDPLIPPENFSIVASGVYRSGFPKKRNFKFMEGLRLKTVLTLVLEDYPDGNLKWCEERDVQFMVSLLYLDLYLDGLLMVAIRYTGK